MDNKTKKELMLMMGQAVTDAVEPALEGLEKDLKEEINQGFDKVESRLDRMESTLDRAVDKQSV